MKGKLTNQTGRLVLIDMVLTFSTTYFLTSLVLNVWAVKKVGKFMRGFLGSGDEEAHVENAWSTRGICVHRKL